jgi:hypothetical protein
VDRLKEELQQELLEQEQLEDLLEVLAASNQPRNECL